MEPLLSDLFPDADKSAWLMQVQKELKSTSTGNSPYESLRWPTDEGFVVEPYYTADDLNSLPLETIQAVQKQVPGWLNVPERQITNERTDSIILRDSINRGADALILNLPSAAIDLSWLLNGIKLSDNPVFFKTNDPTAFVDSLKTVAPYQLRGGLLTDPMAQWLQSGQPVGAGYQTVADVTKATFDSPQFRTICANSHLFHNAGATATQELAFLLASLADQYDHLTDLGLTIEQLVSKTLLSVSVGTHYFMEIAKLRALRVLLVRFLTAYGSVQSSLFIHCQTSTFYDAAVTPYANLLRATTETMAAVMGGCDALTVHPYDTVSGLTSDHEFADRIARNISILLKEESYLNKVADPAAGSYYIENLTQQLVESAWALFLAVEKRGGFERAFTDGFIAGEIEQAYQAKVDAIRAGKVLVGVTKFRSDEIMNQLNQSSETSASLLPDRRLAAEFE
ncbi:methylmalonyl-CoA mutase [Spirosoma aureum]|uniref:Methylmalonyl-CoA mutase n=1 Tax=Spirosoma aureum TaxID=2692134 RepID=A0A6G9AJD5_9BACT|nr:methylmalonyl-CoA mutase family protein [Spirosoma aureum]QIP12293.1 methylmalonyl-CoA mutase [Spirosoma aureum]